MPFILVIEPREQEIYSSRFPYAKILSLKDNHQGITYARHSIQEHSEQQGNKYHWQIDDNIRSFKERIEDRNKSISAKVLLQRIEMYIDQFTNIGIAGPAYEVWAFGYSESLSINRQSSSCMLIRNDTGFYFRGKGLQDCDLHIQMLSSNDWCTLRFNKLLIDKMKTGTLSGGCTDSDYKNKGREQSCIDFIERWKDRYPEMFQINSKNPSRLAPSRIWSIFKQRPINDLKSFS